MVGDRLDNDIAPAKKLGMKTVWVRQGYNYSSISISMSSDCIMICKKLDVMQTKELTHNITGYRRTPYG